MPLSRTVYNTWVDDSGAAVPDGTVVNKAFIDAIYDDVDAALVVPEGLGAGAWVTVPFSAGNFTGGGTMSWTVDAGDVVLNRYLKIGKLFIWSLQLATTTTAGTATDVIRIAVPAGIALVMGHYSLGFLPANVYATPFSSTVLDVRLTTAANFPISANGLYVYLTYVGSVT